MALSYCLVELVIKGTRMITAAKLRELINYTNIDLSRMMDQEVDIHTAEFVGITNAGQFCYKVKYWDDRGGPELELVPSKIFISYESGSGETQAFF